MNNQKKQLLYKKIVDEQLDNANIKKKIKNKKPIIPLVSNDIVKTIDLTEHAKKITKRNMAHHKKINNFGRHDFSFFNKFTGKIDPNLPSYFGPKKKDDNAPNFPLDNPTFTYIPSLFTPPNIKNDDLKTFKETVQNSITNISDELKNNYQNVIIPDIKNVIKSELERHLADDPITTDPITEDSLSTINPESETYSEFDEIVDNMNVSNKINTIVNELIDTLVNYISKQNIPTSESKKIINAYATLIHDNNDQITKSYIKNSSKIGSLFIHYNNTAKSNNQNTITFDEFLLHFFTLSTSIITEKNILKITELISNNIPCYTVDYFYNFILNDNIFKVLAHNIIRVVYNTTNYHEAMYLRDIQFVKYYDEDQYKKAASEEYKVLKQEYNINNRQSKFFSKHIDTDRKTYRDNIINTKLLHIPKKNIEKIRRDLQTDFDKLDILHEYVKEIEKDNSKYKTIKIETTRNFFGQIDIFENIMSLMYDFMFNKKTNDFCDPRIIIYIMEDYPNSSQISKYLN